MPRHPNLVEWRLEHGSLCHLCPLRGQRMVGTDGPLDAPHIGLAEAPGKDEETHGLTRGERYGRPLIGASGYFFKLEQLVPNRLARLVPVPGREWPRVELDRTFLMNVIMCRPPRNKIVSPQGRAAVRCCANSARALLRTLLAENRERTITFMGGTALDLLMGVAGRRGKGVRRYAVDSYRGRFLTDNAELAEQVGGGHVDLATTLQDEPIEAIVRATKKFWRIPEWWPAIEWFLREVVKQQRVGVRKVAKRGRTAPAEFSETREIRDEYCDFTAGPDCQDHSSTCPRCTNPAITSHATVLDLLLKKQRAALRKAAKRAATEAV